MKKVFCLILAAALVMLTFAGCGENTTVQKNELPMQISQDDWNDARQYVDLSTGIKMSYVEMGDPEGPVMILQHGMTDNSRSWSLVAPYFTEAGYHVYMPDLRGMGKSDAPDGYYTPITYATDLKAFCDALNIDKATVIGHSLGSYTVQLFSIMFPEKCEKIVLVSSLPIINYQNDRLIGLYENFIEPLGEDEKLSNEFLETWYNTTLAEEEFADVFDEFLSCMKEEAQALSKKAWKNICLGFVTMNMTDLYDQIDHSIPVLVLHGDADGMALTEYQQELLDIFEVDENSYVNYEGIGHNIHFEMPKKCAADILTWLDTGTLNKEVQ